MSVERLSIGKLAKATGTKVETVWLLSVGLLAPSARTNLIIGHILHTSMHGSVLSGWHSIDQVREILKRAAQKDLSCKPWARSRAKGWPRSTESFRI